MTACPSCATENPDGAKFCAECGTGLAAVPLRCPSCGAEASATAKFCLECGGALGTVEAPELAEPSDVADPHEVRKVVSIVFSDLKGSTSLAEKLDSEAMREVMGRYFDAMSAELVRHGGTIEKFIGDAIMAVFGLPKLHEDDALRAVRAAAAMQQALVRLNDELEQFYGVRLANRTGVNTGEVVAGDPTTGQRLVTGDVVNVAARLEQAAGESEVLIGELTHRLVRDSVEAEPVEPLTLKGKSEPVPAFRLLSIRATEGDAAATPNAPMVGRKAQVAQLVATYEGAQSSGRCRLATIIGEAGLGKSRLTADFLESVGEEAVGLRGRCLPYGEGITFWPVVEAVRTAAGITDEVSADDAFARLLGLVAGDQGVAERVAAAIGIREAQFVVDELFYGIRRFFEVMAAERPVVVVFEDIHWAEQTFLDLIDHLVDEMASAMTIICAARPQFVEDHAGWGRRDEAAWVELTPLSPEESDAVVRNVLGGAMLDADTTRRINEAAEGNPLFVEQLLSMLIDEGALRREDDEWVVVSKISQLNVPPTIQALLATRLDALGRSERVVIESAAVIGYIFAEDAVLALVPDRLSPRVPAELAALTQKQLVRPEGTVAGNHRFHHILVRDTAYDGILKRQRASLHAQFVAWADSVNREGAVEYEEILGYHLEQAVTYLLELGPLNDRGRGLAADGAARLSSAGLRAFNRGDAPAAASLLGRALALLPENDPGRLEILPDLGEALLQTDRLDESLLLLTQGLTLAHDSGDEPAAAKLRLVRLLVTLRSGADGWSAEVEREVSRAIEVFEAAPDRAGLAKAWRLLAWSNGISCRFGEAARAAERALAEARLAGDVRQERRAANLYANAVAYGPTPVAESIERCEEMLRGVAGDRHSEGWLLTRLASMYAMQCSFDQARELGGRGRRLLEELSLHTEVAFQNVENWRIEMLAGDVEAAELFLREAYDSLTDSGDRHYLSTVAGLLAQTLFERGRYDEATPLVELTEELAADDDVETQALRRCVRAKLLAREGRLGEAEILVREAYALLAPTDAVVFQIGTLIDLAGVLESVDEDGRQAALTEALALAAAKGDDATADYIRGLVAVGT